MKNKTFLYIIIGVILLGGVFFLAKQQTSVAPSIQREDQSDALEGETIESNEKETLEDKVEVEDKDEEVEEADVENVENVSLTDSGFDPKSITIKISTQVVWVNDTQATGNVSSAVHPTHEEYPPLNLGNFEPGETISLVFTEPGTYKYHDHLNPTKFGTVVVE